MTSVKAPITNEIPMTKPQCLSVRIPPVMGNPGFAVATGGVWRGVGYGAAACFAAKIPLPPASMMAARFRSKMTSRSTLVG